MKRLGRFLSWLCVAIFFVVEVHNPKAMVVFVAGLVARKQLMNWWDALTIPHEATSQWAYTHATLWADGHPDHRPLRATKCLTCTKQ